MTIWKNPPKAKIFEALSAIADGRVKLLEGQSAEVASSDRSKSYSVAWSEDLKAFTSNDNTSYWQGYMGYPLIAVLMLLGKIDFSREAADLLGEIPWKQLNKRFRNDYAKAVECVLDDLEAAPATTATQIAIVTADHSRETRRIALLWSHSLTLEERRKVVPHNSKTRILPVPGQLGNAYGTDKMPVLLMVLVRWNRRVSPPLSEWLCYLALCQLRLFLSIPPAYGRFLPAIGIPGRVARIRRHLGIPILSRDFLHESNLRARPCKTLSERAE